MGARVVQRYVMNEISDPDLSVYMVWLPINPGDDLEQAHVAAEPVRDPRVEHFWIPDPEIPELFKTPLGMDGGSAWDVFLLYGADAEWGDDLPVPDSFMHQGQPLPAERVLDARALADEVRAQLATGGGTAGENGGDAGR